MDPPLAHQERCGSEHHSSRQPNNPRSDTARRLAMSSPAQPHRPNITPAVTPIGPSIVVKLMVAPMSRMLNPLVGKLAGRRHFPMAQIHHVGRRRGNRYVTSVGARVNGDVALIPLTFGNRSDWARNVVAAGGCSIRLNGRSYQA